MDDNSVPLADVLMVLDARKVVISAVDSSSNAYILAQGGIVLQLRFHDPVGKKMLQYLCHKFNGVYMHMFWHPQMALIKPGEQIQ